MSRIYRPRAWAAFQVVFDGFGASDSEALTVQGRPTQMTIHRNGYNLADSWEVTFDASYFPVDPQLVRAGSADLYLYTVEPGAPEGPPAGRAPTVTGLFDDMDIELSASGRWVTIQGQDYTALLLAKHWTRSNKAQAPARRVPVGKPLDVTLRELLREAEPLNRLRLVVEDVDYMPVVGKLEANGSRRGITVESETSYWDVMSGLATRYGLLLFVRGSEVVLAKPRILDDVSAANARQIAWGKNLEQLRLQRHLGQEKVPKIVVRGYDKTGRKAVTAEYPETLQEVPVAMSAADAARVLGRPTENKKGETKKTATEEYRLIPVWGVTDKLVLRQMARSLFAVLGKSERKVIAKTHDLTDLASRDMLSLSAGDAVHLQWQDMDRALLQNPAIDQSAKVRHLKARGFGEAVATEIAKRFDQLLGIDRPMRVREVSYTWDINDGTSIEMELQDFVKVDGVRKPA